LWLRWVQAQVEAEARIKQERENRDIREAMLIKEAEEHRITVLQSIKAAGKTVGDGFDALINDPFKVASTVGIITGLALGIYSARCVPYRALMACTTCSYLRMLSGPHPPSSGVCVRGQGWHGRCSSVSAAPLEQGDFGCAYPWLPTNREALTPAVCGSLR
jgi:hypothetical protein